MELNITILIHERSRLEKSYRYIASYLWRGWEERGHNVRIAQGVHEPVRGDIVFVHVDRTVVPDAYLEYAARFPAAVNGKVRTIAKDTFSTLLLRPGDAWHGKVIVKTKANYGGQTDLAAQNPDGDFLVGGGTVDRPWRKRAVLDPYDYPVFDSIGQVPPGVWRNPHLIVEKFVPEFTEDGLHVVRQWGFMGDQGYVIRKYSPYRIVKARSGETRPERECRWEKSSDPVPEELESLRVRIGIDYGRFDYVEVEGRGVVFDVNTTPATGDDAKAALKPELDRMVEAIEDFV